MKVLVPLAPGLEEIEAVTIIDVLRRAEIETTSVCLGENPVTGSHDIRVYADTDIHSAGLSSYDAIALPGGMPGSENLKNSPAIISLIQDIQRRGGITAALCAAPMILGHAGVLKGKRATCYPGFQDFLTGAEYIPSPFIIDGTVLTGKGPGCAIPFALKLVEMIRGKTQAESLKEAMQVYWM
ncbi:MAG TPA: DJ-1/PfpI family protein [Spirochaetota bacterium]|nr:DJ-1/PfpI family protein [Spirochaetota bacterium]HPI87683.1 DJ-1/PfpI family protein [Spirochaetota bacterium]HPR49705.1 DJ-1/PfpI family protein [Spirochaetota bacterium]